jgi:hypothetical protein
VVKAEVPLTLTDAALLDIIAAWPFGLSISLPKLIENYDFEMREVPTFDEVSYGLARLMARGYITGAYSAKRGIRLKRTRAGEDLRKAAGRHRRTFSTHRWPRIGEYGVAIGDLIGAPRWPAEEVEDRSVGRLPNLARDVWDNEVEQYVKAGEKYIASAARVGRLMRRFLRWRRPGDIGTHQQPVSGCPCRS